MGRLRRLQNHGHLLLLGAVVLLAAILRTYNLAHGTPALTQDELVNGYDAYSLSQTLRDHHGAILPLIFASFGDSVSVALTYITVPFVAFTGLTEFAVRLPIALTGIASVLLIYLLIKEVAGNRNLALLGAFLLAIMPWNITLTRWAVPPSLVPFCLLLFLWLFALAVRRKRFRIHALVAAGLAGGLLTYSYPSAQILAPLLVLAAGIIFLLQRRRELLLYVSVYALTVIPLFYLVIFKPSSNFARFSAVKINATGWDWVREVTSRYADYFSYNFYFGSTGNNPIMHVPGLGNFYAFLLLFIPSAIIIILFAWRQHPRSHWIKQLDSQGAKKIALFSLFWALIAPLPASISIDKEHVTRAIFLLPLATLMLTGAVYVVLYSVRKPLMRRIVIAGFVFVCLLGLQQYVHLYRTGYPAVAAASYQYGVRESIYYVRSHEQRYTAVVIDRTINQPYIYYLFYKPYSPKQLNYDQVNASVRRGESFSVAQIDNAYFYPLTSQDVADAKKIKSIQGYGQTWYDLYEKNGILIVKLHSS